MASFDLVDLADDDSALFAGVRDDHAQRLFDRAADDRCTDLLVALERLDELLDSRGAANERDAAAGDDAFLDSRAGGVHRILDTSLLLLHLGLGGSTDLDHGNAADQLGETLLELLAVVVGGGLVDLSADLLDAALDVAILAAAIDDGGVVLVDGDALGACRGPRS